MNSDIAVLTARYTGHARLSGIEENATKKTSAAAYVIIIMNVKK